MVCCAVVSEGEKRHPQQLHLEAAETPSYKAFGGRQAARSGSHCRFHFRHWRHSSSPVTGAVCLSKYYWLLSHALRRNCCVLSMQWALLMHLKVRCDACPCVGWECLLAPCMSASASVSTPATLHERSLSQDNLQHYRSCILCCYPPQSKQKLLCNRHSRCLIYAVVSHRHTMVALCRAI